MLAQRSRAVSTHTTDALKECQPAVLAWIGESQPSVEPITHPMCTSVVLSTESTGFDSRFVVKQLQEMDKEARRGSLISTGQH